MSRSRVLAVAAGGLVAVVVVMVVVVSRGSSGDSGSGEGSGGLVVDPRAEGLPAADSDVAAATLEFLVGDGAALLVMHDTAVEVGGGLDLDPESCGSVVEGLNRDAPPDEALSLSAGTEDEVLAAALVSERNALGAALTACVSGDGAVPLTDRVAAAADAAALVEARLAQLQESAG